MTKLEQSIEEKYEKVLTEMERKCNGEEKPLSYGYGVRHLQVILLFVTLCITLISRSQISATIVAMTDIPEPGDFDCDQNITYVNLTFKGMNDNMNIQLSTELKLKNNSTNKVASDELNIHGDNMVTVMDLTKSVSVDHQYISFEEMVNTEVMNDEFDLKNYTNDKVKVIEFENNGATIVIMMEIPKQVKFFIQGVAKKENRVYITFGESNNTDDIHLYTGFDLKNNSRDNMTLLASNGIQTICEDNERNITNCKIILSNDLFKKETNDDLNNSTSIWNVYRVYAWPKSTQEMVLGSFFLGYLIMTSPMGLVCQRWGGKLPLQISLFSSAIITFLTPWLAVLGDYKAVCLTRVAIGLTQAGTYPSIQTLAAKWVPASERGRLVTYVYTGSMIGSVLAYHVSGFLSVSIFGWPSVFWVTGILCLLMGLLVTCFVTPSPQQNRFISEEEKNFILGGAKDQTEKRYATPWKAIMTSKPVWACFVAHIGTSTSYLFLFTQIPSYLHHAIGLNIKNSGLLSSLPYLANFVMSIILGIASDYLINKKIMSTKLVRIVSNCIASVGPASAFFALSFISDPTSAVICLVYSMGTHASTHTAWMINYIDLGPNFSGTLMATGNTLMNIMALILPVLVSNIVTDMTNVYQWRIVLFIVGAIALLCNAVYVIFMSADVQPWNDAKYQTAAQDDPDVINDESDEKHSDISR